MRSSAPLPAVGKKITKFKVSSADCMKVYKLLYAMNSTLNEIGYTIKSDLQNEFIIYPTSNEAADKIRATRSPHLTEIGPAQKITKDTILIFFLILTIKLLPKVGCVIVISRCQR
ncbi:hypothetical protein SK128_024722 [Halocaridina rubra]|uniref:Uncharacterized protein n=1 Tax=Halocaridina rubra TaxID=373956 RepID=A0AAN8WDT6_HALRR